MERGDVERAQHRWCRCGKRQRRRRGGEQPQGIGAGDRGAEPHRRLGVAAAQAFEESRHAGVRPGQPIDAKLGGERAFQIVGREWRRREQAVRRQHDEPRVLHARQIREHVVVRRGAGRRRRGSERGARLVAVA